MEVGKIRSMFSLPYYRHITFVTSAIASSFLISNKKINKYFSFHFVNAQTKQDTVMIQDGKQDKEAVQFTNQVSILKSNKKQKNISKILKSQEFSRKIDSNFYSPVSWFETNHYSANNPIEDRHCECSLLKNNAFFFGIFDGHSGWHCSESLRLNLPLYVSLAFSNDNLLKDFNSGKLSQKDFVQYLGNPDDNCLTFATPNGYKSKQDKLKTGPCNFAQFMNTEKYSTSEILQYAYLSMDRDITLEAIPDGECIEPIWTGLSGSVAIGAYIKENDVFVASTGDCRGVLGVKSDQKLWLSIPLSEDHTADNINEVLRIKKEHPNEEHTVILQSRLLGQLQPLRSFGDVIYKWSKELHRQVLDIIYGYAVVPISIYKSPPYLTAQPDIMHKILNKDDRFIILASDGLWDTVSNDQAVQIIGKYLDNLENGIKDEENGATKLIRYALGQGDNDRLYSMLELPQKVKRNYHDDITVTVIYFDSKLFPCNSKL
ncbi:pyruvate dehydrogenase [acetyl-transferring]-phosphatase 2, mitochondrial [Hydra vulgaris]|uniref:pyruvate dehydrogenase [acetyl-transferring]-phosphatase 2, mitochondrial n=1 Tax=Hydra vulgaris TaxID=6087 RepID=UPI0032EA64CC